MIIEEVKARGHMNVLCLHKTSSEFTSETHLTPRGDCIFAVGSDKTLADLSDKFKDALRSPDAVLEVQIRCGPEVDTITACGHPDLTLTHPTDFVIRKSDYVCDRTLAVSADKAASDLDRGLVEELAKAGECFIKLTVK